MPRNRTLVLFALFSLAVTSAVAQKKKQEKEPVTQTLTIPKDPPAVTIGDSTKIVFHVSPLSGKGLLTQQTHDALKALFKANDNARILHIRAFVAGSGDVRRIPQIVSEVFTAKKMPLPSVSVIQAGGLALEGAQVVIEATSEGKKEANPSGITFIPAQDSVDKLATAIGSATAIQVSCFTTDLSDAATLTSAIASRFPSAAVDLIQTQRNPGRAPLQCEAVARGGKPGWLAFTGTRAAFGGEESDIRQAFTRLYKDLTDAGAPPAGIVSTNIYPISTALGIVVKGLIEIPGAITIVPFEGVASMDASLAVDAVALAPAN